LSRREARDDFTLLGTQPAVWLLPVNFLFRFSILGLIAGFLAGPVFAAMPPDVVRLGNLKFAHYGAVWYMKELAPKYGLKIEEQIFAKGLDIFPAITAGHIDVSAQAVDAAIAARAAGVPIYVVAGFAQGGARIVGRSDLALKTVADLKGRTVGVPRGGAHELLLLAELAQNKLTWSDQPGRDVRIVYLGYADLTQAMLAKSIDAMCQSEPQASLAIAQKIGTEIVKPYDTPLGAPIRALVITEQLYRERPAVAARFLQCFVEASRLFIDKPEVAEKFVREVMFKKQLSHEEYVEAIANSPFTTDITPEHVQLTTDYMMRYGVGRMAKPPLATDFVRLDLLDRAKQMPASK
jgi:NitT/TauT family transport system substrate-binding protein